MGRTVHSRTCYVPNVAFLSMYLHFLTCSLKMLMLIEAKDFPDRNFSFYKFQNVQGFNTNENRIYNRECDGSKLIQKVLSLHQRKLNCNFLFIDLYGKEKARRFGRFSINVCSHSELFILCTTNFPK